MLNRATLAAAALSSHNPALAGSLLAFPLDYMTAMIARAALRVATAAPVNTTLPAIFGAAQVGQVEVTTTGVWNQPVTSYAYEWQASADGVTGWADIGGATSSSYTPVIGDVGKYLRSGVLASNSFGPAVAGYAYSLAAGPIAAAGVTGGNISFDWSDPNSSITFGL